MSDNVETELYSPPLNISQDSPQPITHYRRPPNQPESPIQNEIEQLVISGINQLIDRFNQSFHPILEPIIPHTLKIRQLTQTPSPYLPQLNQIPYSRILEANRLMNRDLTMERFGSASTNPIVDGVYQPYVPQIATVSESSRETAAAIHTAVYGLSLYLSDNGIKTEPGDFYRSLITELLPLTTAENTYKHYQQLTSRRQPPSPPPADLYPILYPLLTKKPDLNDGGLGWLSSFSTVIFTSHLSQIDRESKNSLPVSLATGPQLRQKKRKT